jgi:hypothetical protein
VVVSLIYLAIQIRGNTRTMRANAFQGVLGSTGEFISHLIHDDGLAQIYSRGVEDYAGLSENEQTRFDRLLMLQFHQFQNLYFQSRQGLLEGSYWESFRDFMLWHVQRPGPALWWTERKNMYSTEFQDFLDGSVEPQRRRPS